MCSFLEVQGLGKGEELFLYIFFLITYLISHVCTLVKPGLKSVSHSIIKIT